MKNFEKYIDEIVGTLHKFSEEHYHESAWKLGCYFLMFDLEQHDHDSIKQWLLAEYQEPIKLTHDEYVILKNLPCELKFITRDEDGELNVFKTKPSKNLIRKDEKGAWASSVRVEFEEFDKPCLKYACYDLELFNHLFQFMKWEDEEPYEIAKLIADYEKENKDGIGH